MTGTKDKDKDILSHTVSSWYYRYSSSSSSVFICNSYWNKEKSGILPLFWAPSDPLPIPHPKLPPNRTYLRIPWFRLLPREWICGTICCHFHGTSQLWSQSQWLMCHWNYLWKIALILWCELFSGRAWKHRYHMSKDRENIYANVLTCKITNITLQQPNFLFVKQNKLGT